MIVTSGNKKIEIVRSRSAHVVATSSAKMATYAVSSAGNDVLSSGVKAMRQMSGCSKDMAHKSAMDTIKDAITFSAIASHDVGYGSSSTAAHSVESSAAAAKAYRKAMSAVDSMDCAKCVNHMAAMKSALQMGIDTMSANCGDDDDSAGSTFKGITRFPDTLIYPGMAVKRISKSRVAGRLVCFTDETKKDADGEFFDKDTDFMIGVYPIKDAMSLYNHGLDRSIGSCPIGTVVSAEVKADGIHIEAELNFLTNYKAYLTALEAPDKWKTRQIGMAEKYDQIIQSMIEDGTLGWSSGAHSPSVVKSKNGHIERWPIIEASATPIPAMPFETKVTPLKQLLAFDGFKTRAE